MTSSFTYRKREKQALSGRCEGFHSVEANNPAANPKSANRPESCGTSAPDGAEVVAELVSLVFVGVGFVLADVFPFPTVSVYLQSFSSVHRIQKEMGAYTKLINENTNDFSLFGKV